MELKPVKMESGERYGKLTVLWALPKKRHGGTIYRCSCDCGYGNVKVRAAQLMKGKVKSCVKCANASSSR